MNYAEMSDFEVNCAVAYHIGLSTVRSAESLEFDPCNSWADAGPIIQGNLISIDSIYEGGDIWLAIGGCDCEHKIGHRNPLRAAMIVFLMLKGGEQ